MNPFKGVSGRRCKRKSKSAEVEVKQELGIKEEPTNDGDDVMNIPRPRVDGRYRANYEGPIDFGYGFDEVKDEVKCEGEETGKEKDSASCERLNDNADDNEEPMGEAIDVQPPQPAGNAKKRVGSTKRRNKRTIRRNQAPKKQKKQKMNPFKGVSSGRCKRKSKSAKVEVKQELGIKEEPTNDGDDVMNIPRSRVDGRYRANYEGPIDFGYDFDEVKDEIKCEEEETGKEKDSAPCERLNDNAANAANADDNEEPMGEAIDVQPPQPAGNAKKRVGSTKRRNKRTIPRNQVAKKQKKHKCHVCNHLASTKSNLKIHSRIHTGEKPFQCDVCSKSFSDKGNLNKHKKTHGQFRCSKCNQGFEQESAKIDHERLCNPRRFECDCCGYKAMQKPHLERHMRIHSGEKPFECSICSKSFARNTLLRSHSMTHKDELPNACSKCGRRFASPGDKQTHETHCQRSLFACNQCHYKTVYKASFKRHMQSKHEAKRSIECEIRSKQFVQRMDLNRHLSSKHSDRFPFQCSKCFGGFATVDAKEVHEDSCGHRQYQCHLCKKHRRDKQMLKIHMRKDHTGERIQCKVCATNFTNKSNTNQHMKTAHRLENK